jgi:hypothetical protein
VVVSFGQLHENYRSIPHLWAALLNGWVHALIETKKGLGYILGEFFYKLIWSTCQRQTCRERMKAKK